MKICVITTAEDAATNVGDALIAKRCAALLADTFTGADICSVYRRQSWPNVKAQVLSSNLIVFACLAIRKGGLRETYSFIDEIISSTIPTCVVSAGISLGGYASLGSVRHILKEDEVDLLQALSKRSLFFSSRGYLTQSVLDDLAVASQFAGDVAFYQPAFRHREFRSPEAVRRIAISDPHYASDYKNSFFYLVEELRRLFPLAQIELLAHAANTEAETMSAEAGIPYHQLYLGKGLDAYDDYDLHVGYRIHGHVSALVRRIPSYLLEQDDRGTDYGSTFTRRISVASHRNIARQSQVLISPIDTIIAILRQDLAGGFERFKGLETEIEACGQRNAAGLKHVLSQLELSGQSARTAPPKSPLRLLQKFIRPD